MKLKAKNLKELEEIAPKIIEKAADRKVWLFYGEMGAGKTTLIKIICKLLGVIDEVSSPTFSLVNEYDTIDGKSIIYHFDFYRLESEDEAMDMGYEEYFYSGNCCLVEWPEKISQLLPQNVVKIKIEQTEKERIYIID